MSKFLKVVNLQNQIELTEWKINFLTAKPTLTKEETKFLKTLKSRLDTLYFNLNETKNQIRYGGE